jgi:hypothetical protein
MRLLHSHWLERTGILRCTIACDNCGMREPMHPLQIAGLRRMSAAKELELVCELYHAGIAVRAAGLRLKYRDWPQEKLEFEAKRALRHAGT